MITVFYDGKCGLCRREIAHYMRIAPKNVFSWVDITTTPDAFTQLGFSLKDGLKALHVQDNNGTIHIGVAGFMVIWQKLPHIWKLLYYVMKLPFILPITQKLYTKFAAWRFQKLGYDTCNI